MKDFTYYNPTKIEFGLSKEKEIGRYIKEAGISKVLFVYGMGSIKKSGLYDEIILSLNKYGISYEELNKVVSNPLLSRVNDGIQLARRTKVQAILGVGGGSVADTIKAIAVGVKYEGDVWDFFTHKALIKEALPIFTVMTLAATASEMNGNSVITHDETKEKFSIASVLVNPVVSVINPELMASVSSDYLSYSAVDAIAHVIEVYFTATYHSDFNSRLVESIIKSIMSTTEILLKNPSDYDARGEFAWIATQALNGLTPAGTEGGSFPNHMIEHALSALYNVPHGAGLSVVIPAWMKWYKDKNIPQFERFAKEVFGLKSAEEGIYALEAWFAKIGSPITLEGLNIPKSDIPAIAKNAYVIAKTWGYNKENSLDNIIEVLQKA
ncbi:iron-containing alcohol dehydrogenase [Sulfurimonas sp. SAG-AH-194-L11]|nr:iron-containing alcohol dehydrogenase [Sulfurimonas sp. SAG-AH-194-L11]MDF1877499.1 iron-containing alcohol dehydrogenase [Sulfurimonas sp. SAG-AH-194-L11]